MVDQPIDRFFARRAACSVSSMASPYAGIMEKVTDHTLSVENMKSSCFMNDKEKGGVDVCIRVRLDE